MHYTFLPHPFLTIDPLGSAFVEVPLRYWDYFLTRYFVQPGRSTDPAGG